MQSSEVVHRWIRAVGALCLVAVLLAGCGVQADDAAAPASTTTTVPAPDITLPARVDGAVPAGAFAAMISVVDRVGHSTAAVTDADDPSATDSAYRSLVVTSGSLDRFAVLLVDVDDEGLDELAGLLGDLVESVDALTAEVAAGRTDLANAVAGLEDRVEAVQRRWAARADAWEAAWQQAGQEWQSEWDRAAAEWEAEWDRAAAEWEAEWDRAAAEWEAEWDRAAAEWEAEWDRAAAEWEAEWDRAAAEWDAQWEQVAEDWERAAAEAGAQEG